MKNVLYYPKTIVRLYLANYSSLMIPILIISGLGLFFDLLSFSFPSIFSGPWITSIMLFARFLILALFNITLFRIVNNLVQNKKTEFSNELFAAKKNYKGYVVLSAMLFVIIFAGSLLFIIPGIIFAVWYFASTYLAATESIKPLNALDLSRKRVEGNFWPVLSRLIVSILVIPLPIMVILSILTSLGTQTANVTSLLSIFSNFLFTLLFLPYLYMTIALIYEDLKK